VIVSLSTGSLYTYGLERVFALAAEAGFDAVEVLVDERWDTRQPHFLAECREKHEMPIASLHVPFALRVDGWETDPICRLWRTVDLARALGVGVVVAHLPFRWHDLSILSSLFARRYVPLFMMPRDGPYADWLLHELPRYETETGVVIGVENMPARRWLWWQLNPCRLNSVADLARFPHVTLDTTHLATWGIAPLPVYQRLRDRIVNVHLSNFDGYEHRLPWAGALPLERFVAHLATDGYAGNLTVELHPGALGAGDDDGVREALARCARFCRVAVLRERSLTEEQH